jgi:ligand-binding sensor domain-containing protein/signal transduction histidine kinase
MPGSNRKRIAYRTAQVLALMIMLSGTLKSEHLPVKTYTTADGLAHNVVNRIVRDSRGFLWFCTREGLSRFDGYSFTNYGIAQGLPSAIINDLLETREGLYWVATAGGLCRFDPLGKPQAGISSASEKLNAPGKAMFTVYFPGPEARSRNVLSLLQDRTGTLWCGTRNGLYRVEPDGAVKIVAVDLGIADYLNSRFIECLLEDREGTLWVGADSGLYRRWREGRVESFTVRDGLPANRISSVLEDREGRIWIGMLLGGLCRLVRDPTPGRNVVARAYSVREGLSTYWINSLFQASDGSLWAGSNAGLLQFIPTADGRDFRFRVYAEPQGLSYREVEALAEDGNGNLWVGMQPGGAAKIVRSGFTTFGKEDGFSRSSSLCESRAGNLLVLGGPDTNSGISINQYDGEKFVPLRPQLPQSVKDIGYGWGWNQTVLEDHTGEWWIATGAGVCRFPKITQPEQLAHLPPKAIYTTRDGLAANMILRLFEDSRGDIWIGSVGQGLGPSGLSRWERRTGAFQHYTEKDQLPSLNTFYVSSFAEDRGGNLWIGFSGDGGLVRCRDGRFTRFTAGDGVPAGQIRNMLVDSAGRLWAATYQGGLSRIDDPTAESPRFVTYTTGNGLSSNVIGAVGEDQWGRIYIGTGRGIDRLDPATDRIKHYTTADGLPLGEMEATLRDRQGALWFSFSTGPVRLVPEPDPPPMPPPILITGLRIAGEPQSISALGAVEMTPIELGANKNQLQIDFVALGFSPGEDLRYQYKLEGASDEWSALADQRTVNFAQLTPGRYRFLVQAVNADGMVSQLPASFPFTILPPIWQRWWFIALGGALAGLIAYALYRYRVARLLELERIRTRIATDLHDDIGANLSLIAMASEVASRRSLKADQQMTEALSLISGTSRELIDSMGDIVWAVNPQRDHLVDLVKRMRRFASDVFSARHIAFNFEAPVDDRDIRLGTETRREVLLIFKEAINNIARHSACARAEIEFKSQGGWLMLKLKDNGKGFDPSQSVDGNGLLSMDRRAERLGGTLEVISHKGEGTVITLKTPLR